MRRWASALVVVAVALVGAAAALADTPADVYSDYAADGVLECGHSRSALNGVLNDASIYQYGDPLTLLQLKLVIRKQLAGGCRHATRQAVGFAAPAQTTSSGSTPVQPRSESGAREPANHPRAKHSVVRQSAEARGHRGLAGLASDGDTRDGWMVLVGVGLLLLALAAGGWAARRAFSTQR